MVGVGSLRGKVMGGGYDPTRAWDWGRKGQCGISRLCCRIWLSVSLARFSQPTARRTTEEAGSLGNSMGRLLAESLRAGSFGLFLHFAF